MDEADNLIAQTLAQSGWSKELPRIGAMVGEDLVPLVAWGLGRIDGTSDAAAPYPKGVAQRHRLAAAFAERIKAHGYNGDCGYNHLLYPSEYDTRQLLLWLVQKLPKVERDDMDEASPEMQVRKTLADALALWMQAPAPTSSDIASSAMATMPRASPLPDFFGSRATLARSTYVATKQPLATDAKLVSQHKQLSLLALNEASLRDEGHVSRAALLSDAPPSVLIEVTAALQSLALAPPVASSFVTFSITPPSFRDPVPVPSPVSKPADRLATQQPVAVKVDTAALDVQKAHVLSLQRQYEATAATVEQLEAQIAHATEQQAAVATHQQTIEAELTALEHDVDIRQQTLDMVADASKNMAKLQAMCDASTKRLEALAAEWATHRAPLDDAIAAQAEAQCAYEDDCRRLHDTIAAYRDEMSSLVESLGQKKAQREALERKYAAAPKSINRSVYTSRIMDIIKQVHKQKADIAKILQDIRLVQKHINVSSEKLKRSEAIAEERLFHAANDASHKSDKRTQYVECYRLFTTIRELFDELIRCVNDGGKRENQTRDLFNWIAQLSNRLNVVNCDQIEADLAQVRAENKALVAQLR